MTENNTPEVEIESTGDGRYRVTVNGKPATGPLPNRTEAARVADQIEGKKSGGGNMMFLLLVIAIVLGLIVGIATENLNVGILGGAGAFVGGMLAYLYHSITK